MQAPFPFLPHEPEVIRTLREASATSAASAIRLDRFSKSEIECLRRAGVVAETPSGAHHLIEDAWTRRCEQQRRRIFVVAGLIVGAIALLLVVVRVLR